MIRLFLAWYWEIETKMRWGKISDNTLYHLYHMYMFPVHVHVSDFSLLGAYVQSVTVLYPGITQYSMISYFWCVFSGIASPRGVGAYVHHKSTNLVWRKEKMAGIFSNIASEWRTIQCRGLPPPYTPPLILLALVKIWPVFWIWRSFKQRSAPCAKVPNRAHGSWIWRHRNVCWAQHFDIKLLVRLKLV